MRWVLERCAVYALFDSYNTDPRAQTIQSISLLAYLAETHDIWGPFLVVAPASTLHNWQQEITRFVPKLKALPYWGNVKDRMTLRKFWSKKEISYDQDAPFHILITSYQLVCLTIFCVFQQSNLCAGHSGSAILPEGQVAIHGA
jgi:SNF2 family DNA or RNA helicase